MADEAVYVRSTLDHNAILPTDRAERLALRQRIRADQREAARLVQILEPEWTFRVAKCVVSPKPRRVWYCVAFCPLDEEKQAAVVALRKCSTVEVCVGATPYED